MLHTKLFSTVAYLTTTALLAHNSLATINTQGCILPASYSTIGGVLFNDNAPDVLTAYFLAPEDGTYTFSIADKSQYSDISFGGGAAFQCCQEPQHTDDGWGYFFTNIYSSLGNDVYEFEVELKANLYYPISLTANNGNAEGIFNLRFSGPSIENSGAYYEYFFFGSDYMSEICNADFMTISTLWTNTYTTESEITSSIVTVSNDITLTEMVENFVYYYPEPTTTTNISTLTETGLTAVETLVTTTSITNTLNDQVTVFIDETIEIPIMFNSSTSYKAYNGTETKTYSTLVETFTNNQSMVFVSTVYKVETPILDITTTSLTPANVTVTETYSTEFITTTDLNGHVTVSTIYYVETPIVKTTSIIATPANVTITETYSTEFITTTDSNGHVTVSTIYYVETPIVKTTSIVATPANVTATTTYSTEFITTTGLNGRETIATIYYVETPVLGATETKYIKTDVSVSTTYSTAYITTTDSQGKVIVSTTYYVEVPSSAKSTSSYQNATLATTGSIISHHNATSTSNTGPPVYYNTTITNQFVSTVMEIKSCSSSATVSSGVFENTSSTIPIVSTTSTSCETSNVSTNSALTSSPNDSNSQESQAPSILSETSTSSQTVETESLGFAVRNTRETVFGVVLSLLLTIAGFF